MGVLSSLNWFWAVLAASLTPLHLSHTEQSAPATGAEPGESSSGELNYCSPCCALEGIFPLASKWVIKQCLLPSPFPQPAGWFFLVLLQQELFPSQLEKCCVIGRNTGTVLLAQGLSHSSCVESQHIGTNKFLVQEADRFISNTDAWMWWVNFNCQQMDLPPSKFFSSSVDLSIDNWRQQWCQSSLTYMEKAKCKWNSKKKVWTSCSVPLSYPNFFPHVFLKET